MSFLLWWLYYIGAGNQMIVWNQQTLTLKLVSSMADPSYKFTPSKCHTYYKGRFQMC
jgi:hypothetical protein